MITIAGSLDNHNGEEQARDRELWDKMSEEASEAVQAIVDRYNEEHPDFLVWMT